mgnify:CR=1 FL=1
MSLKKPIEKGKPVNVKEPVEGAYSHRVFHDDDELKFASDNRLWSIRKKHILDPVRARRTAVKRKLNEMKAIKNNSKS